MKKLLLLSLFMLAYIFVFAQGFKSEAKICFDIQKRIAEQDQLNYCGFSFLQNMMVVNTETKEVLSNCMIDDFKRIDESGLFYGNFPKDALAANTSVMYKGKRFTVIMYPFTKDSLQLVDLIAHENFHSIQPNLTHEGGNEMAGHLDEKQGRILLRLEVEALKSAVKGNKRALKDALAFRKMRFEKYPKAEKIELGMETAEGLATYTGFHFAYTNRKTQKKYFKNLWERFDKLPSYTRSSSYTTGPAYGFCFDLKKKDWQKDITRHYDILEIAHRLYGIPISNLTKKELEKRAIKYSYSRILAEENAREKEHLQKLAHYREIFLEDAFLQINLDHRQIYFNPSNLIQLPEYGTVYPTCTVKDYFGLLKVEKGALLAHDWSNIRLSKPLKIEKNKIIGEGWEIDLKTDVELQKQKNNSCIMNIK